MWEKFESLTYWLWGTPLLFVIVLAGIIFTLLSKGFQFSHLGLILKTPFKKDPEIPESKQKLTPFQAVSIAVGGSVGVSNISGVGTAIATGGPGALFWLWIAALLGMMIKMAEVTLAVYYRTTASDGTHFGDLPITWKKDSDKSEDGNSGKSYPFSLEVESLLPSLSPFKTTRYQRL